MSDISPELLHHMMETKETLGRIEANQNNTQAFLKGVDIKVDKHIADRGAHGLADREESEKKADRQWNTWGTTIMAAGAFVDLMWRVFHKSGKGP